MHNHQPKKCFPFSLSLSCNMFNIRREYCSNIGSQCSTRGEGEPCKHIHRGPCWKIGLFLSLLPTAHSHSTHPLLFLLLFLDGRLTDHLIVSLSLSPSAAHQALLLALYMHSVKYCIILGTKSIYWVFQRMSWFSSDYHSLSCTQFFISRAP